ncbi:MAG: hypothetical protein LBP59_16840 [Planctomycetaceae bacterium]|nr:hypothetical protein [Planctomycetaceae bacterium]
MRLYSTANERGLHRNSLWGCRAANCIRDGCVLSQVFCYKKIVPLVLPKLSKRNC